MRETGCAAMCVRPHTLMRCLSRQCRWALPRCEPESVASLSESVLVPGIPAGLAGQASQSDDGFSAVWTFCCSRTSTAGANATLQSSSAIVLFFFKFVAFLCIINELIAGLVGWSCNQGRRLAPRCLLSAAATRGLGEMQSLGIVTVYF